jgi:hypothetical protein
LSENTIPLTLEEILIVLGQQSNQKQLIELQQEIDRRWQELATDIEARLGLKPGAIGRDYQIDGDRLVELSST